MIEKLDYYGRGVMHDDGKVIFVENALPGEEVEVKVTNSTPSYDEAIVLNYIKKSSKRVKSKCPYFEVCGGCQLRNMSYQDTLKYKKEKLSEILLHKVGIEKQVKVIPSNNKDYYRNKIELKCHDSKYGFYKKGSHELVEIDRCINAEESINKFLYNINDLNLTNGDITVKTNLNNEIILDIKSKDENKVNIEHLTSKNKIAGIIYNDKVIYGSNHFIETIDDLNFKESYNSFFQINRDINKELFSLIEENINEGSKVIDLCSGVGTLGIIAAKKASKVYSLEIVENSIKDGILNAKMNNRNNIEFICGDAFNLMEGIDADTLIVDPPRKGISKLGIDKIMNNNYKKIIYISFNPITLERDLNILKEKYDIQKIFMLDMFPYSYHLESMCILERR